MYPTHSAKLTKNPALTRHCVTPMQPSCSDISSLYSKCVDNPGFALRLGLKNEQVRELIERSIIDGNFKHVPDLAEKFINKIVEVCDLQIPDCEIYPSLRKFFQEEIMSDRRLTTAFANERGERVKYRAEQVLDLLRSIKPSTMVDIGCGDGQITSELRCQLKLPQLSVTGLEVYVRPGVEKNFTLTQFNGKNLPIESNSQDLVTIFAVLHHSSDPQELIKEAFRILKPGGNVILRDFDADSQEDKLFQLIMDQMLYEVYTPYPDVPIPGTYHSLQRWEDLFRKSGFTVSTIDATGASHPYKPFMALFRKPGK